MNKKYSGIIVPAVTPLTSSFQLDEAAVEKMFKHFYDHNVMPFILGTTGESTSLPVNLKEAFVKKAVKLKKQGTLLYAGISANCVQESVDFARFCFDNGVDAVAATLPSYYALTESQMKKYFEQLAESVNGPLIVYNIPGTTHMSIPLHIIDELSRHENIVATKDSERSDDRLQQSIDLWKNREDFSHLLGWAARSAVALINGSDGLIPSTGNLKPSIYSNMLKAVENGNEEEAREYQRQSDLYGDLYQKGRLLGESLYALKLLMSREGLCEPHVMPPLQPLSQSEVQKIADEYNNHK